MELLKKDAKQLIDNVQAAPEWAQPALFGAERRARAILFDIIEGTHDALALRGKMNEAVRTYRREKEYLCSQGRCW